MTYRKKLILRAFMCLSLGGINSGLAVAETKAAPGAKPAAADADKGAQLYQAKLCATCHGEKGNKPIAPNYPKLGGQNAAYLVAQYNDIISGKRNNGQTALMKATLTSMKVTDEESKAISEWLAKQ